MNESSDGEKEKRETSRKQEQEYICNENEELLTSKQTCERFNVCQRTLTRWINKGTIKFTRTKGGHKRYICRKIISEPRTLTFRETGRYICYARVSSASQKKDLERQIEYLRNKYPKHEIIRDIGSGINFKRKGFNSILDSAIEGNVREIVVTYKDRLCRFGFEFFERIISTYSKGEIVVLNQQETSPEKELVDDLISIITVFSSRIHGLRSCKIKKQIKENTSKERRKTQNDKIENVSN